MKTRQEREARQIERARRTLARKLDKAVAADRRRAVEERSPRTRGSTGDLHNGRGLV